MLHSLEIGASETGPRSHALTMRRANGTNHVAETLMTSPGRRSGFCMTSATAAPALASARSEAVGQLAAPGTRNAVGALDVAKGRGKRLIVDEEGLVGEVLRPKRNLRAIIEERVGDPGMKLVVATLGGRDEFRPPKFTELW